MKRIIPCLTFNGENSVITINFVDRLDGGDIINAVRFFSESDADELLVAFPNFELFEKNKQVLDSIVTNVLVPINIAGAIRDIEDADSLFKMGTDKISLVVKEDKLALLEKISSKYGAQATCGIIHLTNTDSVNQDLYLRLCRQAITAGVGEILVIDVEREGTGRGMNLKKLESFSEISNQVPLLVRGGVSDYKELNSLLKVEWINGVVASSLFSCTVDKESVLFNYDRDAMVNNDL
jgi:imidazole glycerol phosphate synthase subunit HisF